MWFKFWVRATQHCNAGPNTTPYSCRALHILIQSQHSEVFIVFFCPFRPLAAAPWMSISLLAVLHSFLTVLLSLLAVLHSFLAVLLSLLAVLHTLLAVLHSLLAVLRSLLTVMHVQS